MMKKSCYKMIGLLTAATLLLSGCVSGYETPRVEERSAAEAARNTADGELFQIKRISAAEESMEITLPELPDTEESAAEPSEAEGKTIQNEPSFATEKGLKITIPELPEADEYAAELSETETVSIHLKLSSSSFTIENAESARMRMNNAVVEEDEIGAGIGYSSFEETPTVRYDVVFSEKYELTYQRPNQNCSYMVVWGNDLVALVSGKGIETAECSLSGVRLTGEQMEYKIRYYYENADQTELKVKGTGETAVCLLREGDGFRFYCENGATIMLPDEYDTKAVKSLEIHAGMIGVVESFSKGYDAILRTEPAEA